jgi:hypothetical protein
MRSSTRTVAIILLMIGGWLAMVSVPFQYFAWRVAICSSQYRPASFVVESVTFRKHRRGKKHDAHGTVNGQPETIPLYKFGPTFDSQTELERAYPRGTVLSIWYDPEAPKGVVLLGTALRMLPGTYELNKSLSKAILTTLGWMAPLAVGLALSVIASRHEKVERTKDFEEAEVRKEARRRRKAEARLRRLADQEGGDHSR